MRAARRPDSLFWVDPARIAGQRLSLDPDESRHLLRVFRAESGAEFDATDGRGTRYHCRLVEDHHGEARAEITGREPGAGELPGALHLLVGLPDSRAAETIVEHAVPLGVASIVFAACRRSGREELSGSRLERLERIAIAGVKQSLRSRLPAIESVPSLAGALDRPRASLGWCLVADPDGPSAGTTSDPKARPQTVATLAVGPPGGFEDGERAQLRQAGFRPISLGPSRLTTETAAIALLVEARKAFLKMELPPI